MMLGLVRCASGSIFPPGFLCDIGLVVLLFVCVRGMFDTGDECQEVEQETVPTQYDNFAH